MEILFLLKNSINKHREITQPETNDDVTVVNSKSFRSSNLDLVSIQSLTNSKRKDCEEVILGNNKTAIGIEEDGSVVRATRYSEILDLRVLDLGCIQGDEKVNGVSPSVYKENVTIENINTVINKGRRYDSGNLNDVSLGGTGLATIVGSSPFNNTGYINPDNFDTGVGKRQLNSFLQVPVPKDFRNNELAIRETDSAKYVFVTSDVYNINNIDDCINQDDFTYYSSRGNEINGCSYWYKDVDNVPSVVRPINLNSLISIVCDHSPNPGLVPTVNIDGDVKYLFRNLTDPFSSTSDLGTPGLLARNTHVYNRLTEALSNKIIVVEHKRINTTLALNENGRLEITCPIARSIIDQGYGISVDDKITYTNALKSFTKDLYNSFIPGFAPSKDKYIATAMTAYSLGKGKYFTRDYENYYTNFKVPNRISWAVTEAINKPPSATPVWFSTKRYSDDILRCSRLPITPLLAPTESIVTVPYRYRLGEPDYIEKESYAIGKYEVPTIWIPHNAGLTGFSLGTEVNISLTFVKNTIIDLTSPEFMSGDVLYDKNSNLLIGKVFRDMEETMELINSNVHPMTCSNHKVYADGYSYIYYRLKGSHLPKKVFMANLGVVEELKSRFGYEEGVHVFKNGVRKKVIKFDQFPYYGIFNTKDEASKYNKYGEHYRVGVDNCLNDISKENTIAAAKNAKRNLEYESLKNDMKINLLNKEIEYKDAEYEIKKMQLNLVKMKAELESLEMELKARNLSMEKENIDAKSIKNCLEIVGLLSKGATMIFGKT